jgi:hypothetical protein
MKTITALFLACFSFACTETSATRTVYLETDTYISSTDASNHAELPYLKVSRSRSLEERSIVKLPTGKLASDPDPLSDNLSAAFSNPEDIVFFPFFIFADIFADLFQCQNQTITSSNLTQALLEFDVLSNTTGTLNGGQLSLQTLNRPWFQSTNWQVAHPFSSAGAWTKAGGDVDPTFTPLPSQEIDVAGTTPETVLSFDITDYLKSLLNLSQPVHYGMMISVNPNYAGDAVVSLDSTQSTTQTYHPRVVSTYSCLTTNSTGSFLVSKQKIRYLDAQSYFGASPGSAGP